jgi:hypothetical protein
MVATSGRWADAVRLQRTSFWRDTGKRLSCLSVGIEYIYIILQIRPFLYGYIQGMQTGGGYFRISQPRPGHHPQLYRCLIPLPRRKRPGPLAWYYPRTWQLRVQILYKVS